jgi:hypothetical protein
MSPFPLAFILLTFNPPPIPTIAVLPADLLECIAIAEDCAEVAQDAADLQQCVGDYEDCSYAINEAHEPSCQVARVWCALEPQQDQAWIDYCVKVALTCPA